MYMYLIIRGFLLVVPVILVAMMDILWDSGQL